MSKKEEILEKLIQAIVDGDEKEAEKMANEAIANGIEPLYVMKHGAIKAMDIVGEKWKKSEFFLSQVMLSAEAMKKCMAILLPKITSEQRSEVSLGKIVIGTVQGDIHDIGKNLVATMLTVAGFEVYDLGVEVPSKKFIEKAQEVEASIIAMSALLTTTRYYQKEVINYLKDMGLRNKYYVVVGGGAVTPDWAIEINADAYGKYADDAVKVCKKLVLERLKAPLSKPLISGE